ncbi:MAG TPA: hypothetical protein VGX76_18280, partial [Pirellulales bacterium]|nr:hypothetical protein [Pirellulales bacterium]
MAFLGRPVTEGTAGEGHPPNIFLFRRGMTIMTAVADLSGKAAIEYLQKNHSLQPDADFEAAKK